MKHLGLFLLFISAYGFISAQSLIDVTPDTAMQNDTVTLSISGSGTNFTQGAYLILLSNENAILFGQTQNIQVVNDELIEVEFIFSYFDPPGIYDVDVLDTSSNPFAELTLEASFELKSLLGPGIPELINSEPQYARVGDTIMLTITGKETEFTKYDTNHLLLESDTGAVFIEPEYIQVVNDTTLQAEFIFHAGHPLGFYDLTYIGHYLNVPVFLELGDAFELLPEKGTVPEIVSVTPDNARQGDTITLTIKTFKTDLTAADPDSLVNALTRDHGFYYILPDTTVIIDSVTLEATYTFTEDHELGDYDYGIYIPGLSMVMEKRDVFTLSKPSSVEQVSAKTSPLNIYPNPSANGRFILDGEVNGEFNAAVIDMNGRVITRARITKNRTDLDLSKESAGTYLLILQNGKTRFTERLVISGN